MNDSEFCFSHRNMTKEIYKKRWFKRFILNSLYLHAGPNAKQRAHYIKKVLAPLLSGYITLTQADILNIPSQPRFVDIYLLLLEFGFVQRGFHRALESKIYWYYCYIVDNHIENALSVYIEDQFILSSGKDFFDFLIWIGGTAMSRPRLTSTMIQHIPTFLDSNAAKELSWFARDELDKLRIAYEKEPGKDHPLTRCLVQRWLLDLKELYQTEKAIQKIKMDQCKEELMMNRWHPDRVEKYLLAGIDIDDM
jgi:hypothetical protein